MDKNEHGWPKETRSRAAKLSHSRAEERVRSRTMRNSSSVVQTGQEMTDVAKKNFRVVGWSRAKPAFMCWKAPFIHAPLNANRIAPVGGEYGIQPRATQASPLSTQARRIHAQIRGARVISFMCLQINVERHRASEAPAEGRAAGRSCPIRFNR